MKNFYFIKRASESSRAVVMTLWPFRRKGRSASFSLRRPRGASNSTGDISSLFGHLRQKEQALGEKSKRLEEQFLATSNHLEGLKNSGDELARQVETLIAVATGRECDSSVISTGIKLIEDAIQFLLGGQTQTEQILKTLRHYETQINELMGAEDELQRAMLPLKCVKTLFKVESAPLGEAFQQMFGALTHEMEGLQDQVRDLFGTKFKQLEQTRQIIGQVVSQLETHTRTLHQLIAAQQTQIESSLDDLRRELGSNGARDSSLRMLTKKMAHQIDRIVMGLQFQDIISQKLHHVVEALPLIQSKFAGENSDAPESDVTRYQSLRQSCRVQAAQLKGIARELSHAETAIRTGVQRVIYYMQVADSKCLSLKEFERLTTSCDGTVQTMVETLETIRQLVNTAVANASKAYEQLRPIGNLTSDLTSNVRAMSAQIQLIGLNAQLQAAQANESQVSTGLEVLSQRTYEISRQTTRISQSAARQLDSLAAGLGQCVKNLQQLQSSGVAQQSILTQDGGAEEKRLHGIRDAALDSVRAIGTALDQMREAADGTLAAVQFSDFHRGTIPALEAPLAAIAERAERWLIARSQDLSQTSLVEDLKRGYTMASEHRILQGAIGGAVPPAAGPDSATETGIELFGDTPEAGSVAPVKNKPEPVLAAAPSATTTNAELGANVDLF